MKKIANNSKVYFIIAFVIMFFMHLFMGFSGDDIYFEKQLDTQSYSEFIVFRYQNWTSRVVIESILVIITRLNVNIWRILDTFMFAIGIGMALKLVNIGNNKYMNAIGWCIFFVYPYMEMSSAGWGATTINYLWCFSMGMVSFLPLINMEYQKKTPLFLYVIAFACLIFGVNQEQMCALILVFNVLYFLVHMKSHMMSKYNVACIIVSVLSMIFIFTCPGNDSRLIQETQHWYPDFSDYGFPEKVYLGVVSMADVLISNKVFLFVFCMFLTIAAYRYARKTFDKVIAVTFMLCVSGITIFRSLLINIFPVLKKYFFKVMSSQEIPLKDISKTNLVTVFAVLVLMIICIMYLLYIVFGSKQLLPQFVFLGGVCSRFILGFSPTVFASGARTAFFLYMALGIVCLFLLKKLYTEKMMSEREKIITISVIMSFAILSTLSTFIRLISI